jgi:hypothetical protein
MNSCEPGAIADWMRRTALLVDQAGEASAMAMRSVSDDHTRRLRQRLRQRLRRYELDDSALAMSEATR